MEKNQKKFLGDVVWWMAIPAVLLMLVITIPCVIWNETLTEDLGVLFSKIVTNFASFYVLGPSVMMVLGLYLAFSKYGNIVLGDPHDKPRMTLWAYIAVIVCTTFGATILRTGAINWTVVAENPPLGLEPYSEQAILMGGGYSIFIWAMNLSAIFCMTGPVVGYQIYVRKNGSVRLSSAFRVFFGDKFADGIGGKIIDILFALSIMIGASSFIGLATPVLSAVMGKLLHFTPTFTTNVLFTLLFCCVFFCSLFMGLDKGIKRLSNLNVYIFIAFLIILLITGPTVFLLNYTTDIFGAFLKNYIDYSTYTNSFSALTGTPYDGMTGYTVFWWAYDFAIGILIGMFGGIVSKGRTIKEMILVYYLAPLVIAIPTSGVLGGAVVKVWHDGLDVFQLLSSGGQPEAISSALASMNWSPVLLAVFAVLYVIFLATSMDSISYTMGTYASTSNMYNGEPSRSNRMMWAIFMSGLALALMYVGGLEPLDAINGIIGLPIGILQFMLIFAVIKMMNQDKAWIHNVRQKETE